MENLELGKGSNRPLTNFYYRTSSRFYVVVAQAAKRYSASAFYETSAKTNENVDEAFRKLAHEMVEIYDRKLVSDKFRTKLTPYEYT